MSPLDFRAKNSGTCPEAPPSRSSRCPVQAVAGPLPTGASAPVRTRFSPCLGAFFGNRRSPRWSTCKPYTYMKGKERETARKTTQDGTPPRAVWAG